jgi:hypothetical protein
VLILFDNLVKLLDINRSEAVSGKRYCGFWPIKCRQGFKTNKSNFQFWELTFDWFVNNPSQDLFGQKPEYFCGN